MQKCWTLLPKKTCSRVWVFCMDVVFKRYGHVQWTAHRSTQYDLPVHVATNYALTSRMQAGVLMRRRRWRCLANGTGNCATDWDLRPGDARHVYVDATRSALWHLSCCCCFVSGGGCWLHGTAPARSPTLLLIVSLSLSLFLVPPCLCLCVRVAACAVDCGAAVFAARHCRRRLTCTLSTHSIAKCPRLTLTTDRLTITSLKQRWH